MNRVIATLVAFVLSGCSGSYRDLSSAFGSERKASTPPLAADSIVITSQRHAGATSYRGGVKIRAGDGSIDVDIGLPFVRSLSIPTGDIAACAMTCFGVADQRVDLLIPKTGSDLEIPSKELLDWCWVNKKPMISGADKRAWEYGGASLPPPARYREQLASRQAFDRQTRMSCAGY